MEKILLDTVALWWYSNKPAFITWHLFITTAHLYGTWQKVQNTGEADSYTLTDESWRFIKERRGCILVDWGDHKEARRVDGLSTDRDILEIFSTASSAFQYSKSQETEEQGFQECSLIIVK